jgi:hypothetical protein
MLGRKHTAVGVLELLWHSTYESGNEIIGDALDVATITDWDGDPQELVRMLMDAGGTSGDGFIELVPASERSEAGEAGKAGAIYRVHDLWDHAPRYVRNRAKREIERLQSGRATRNELLAAAGRKRAATSKRNDRGRFEPSTSRPASERSEAGDCPASDQPLYGTPAPAPAPDLEISVAQQSDGRSSSSTDGADRQIDRQKARARARDVKPVANGHDAPANGTHGADAPPTPADEEPLDRWLREAANRRAAWGGTGADPSPSHATRARLRAALAEHGAELLAAAHALWLDQRGKLRCDADGRPTRVFLASAKSIREWIDRVPPTPACARCHGLDRLVAGGGGLSAFGPSHEPLCWDCYQQLPENSSTPTVWDGWLRLPAPNDAQH